MTTPAHTDPPKEIWLQQSNDPDYRNGWTWCWHEVEDTDVRYVLAAPTPTEAEPKARVYGWVSREHYEAWKASCLASESQHRNLLIGRKVRDDDVSVHFATTPPESPPRLKTEKRLGVETAGGIPPSVSGASASVKEVGPRIDEGASLPPLGMVPTTEGGDAQSTRQLRQSCNRAPLSTDEGAESPEPTGGEGEALALGEIPRIIARLNAASHTDGSHKFINFPATMRADVINMLRELAALRSAPGEKS